MFQLWVSTVIAGGTRSAWPARGTVSAANCSTSASAGSVQHSQIISMFRHSRKGFIIVNDKKKRPVSCVGEHTLEHVGFLTDPFICRRSNN